MAINYDTFDDAALAAMVVEGDNRAFDSLFARHHAAIFAMLVRSAGNNNSGHVDDLMQDAFMKAFINISSYNPERNFGAWICTIAKNTQIDFYRSRRNNALGGNNIPLDGKNGASQIFTPSPEESVIHAQHREQIERCMEQLPDDYRLPLSMFAYDNYTYDDISKALSMNIGTVKTRIFRARMIMRCLLSKEHRADGNR